MLTWIACAAQVWFPRAESEAATAQPGGSGEVSSVWECGGGGPLVLGVARGGDAPEEAATRKVVRLEGLLREMETDACFMASSVHTAAGCQSTRRRRGIAALAVLL